MDAYVMQGNPHYAARIDESSSYREMTDDEVAAEELTWD